MPVLEFVLYSSTEN